MKLILILFMLPVAIYTKTNPIKELRAPHITGYVKRPHPYDLHTTQAITAYLPERLKELERQVTEQGIEATAHALENDSDLDSYLFIIDVQQPYRMVAYSRTPAFTDKTPQELHALLFPTCSADACNVTRTFTHIIATARKGRTYARYLWHADLEPYPQYQIAYVQLITEHDKEYVLGAALYRQQTTDDIIMPHRINTMLERIRTHGLESVRDFIIQDNDPEMYYFIVSMKYPNRMLCQGNNSEYLTNTTPEEEQAFYPPCTQRLCNVRILTNNLLEVARSKEGEGFQPYVLSKADNLATTLKITYVKRFEYNKKKYFIASGHLTPVSAQEVQQLEDFVHNTINLVDALGLNNIISIVRKNRERYHPYIVEMDPPYRYLLHSVPELENIPAREVTLRLKNNGTFPIDIEKLVKKIVTIANRGGGLHAAETRVSPLNPADGLTIKTTYTMPFEFDHKKYFLSASIGIDPSEEFIQKLIHPSTTKQEKTT